MRADTTISGRESAGGLARWELWEGLVQKAEDPVPFVGAITECRILERYEGGLVREIVVRGERLRERVTFRPMESVRFERLSGRTRGWIENRIEEAELGGLSLAFTFSLELEDGPERMAGSYLAAIRSTLEETRRRFAR